MDTTRTKACLFELQLRGWRPTHGVSAWLCLRSWLIPALLFSGSSLFAQDALQNLIALDSGREYRRLQLASEKYTVKSGDFRLLAVPSLEFGWNDNINVSSTDPISSYRLQPMLQLDMTYPLTEVNLLTVNLGVGYDEYFDHPDYSGWVIRSGSELAFDVFIKDFVINFHERVSYSQDPTQQSELVNASEYSLFLNTVGLAATWMLKDASFTLGYDHQNEVSSGSRYDSQNSASEIILARASWIVHPQVQTGLEGTISYTKYTQRLLNDNTAYSVGPFVTWQPGAALRFTVRGGYVYYEFQKTSAVIQNSNLGTYYFDITATHDISEVISYGLSFGRNVELGIQSDTIVGWYVRPNVTWRIFQHISLTTGLDYQHGDQGVGYLAGGPVEQYDWLGFNVGLNWPLMKRLSMGLNYRLTLRSSNLPDHGYSQNLVGLILTYRPQ